MFPEQEVPEDPVEEPKGGDDDVAVVLIQGEIGERVWLTDWLTRRYVGNKGSTAVAELQYVGIKGPTTIPSAMLYDVPEIFHVAGMPERPA